MNSFELTIFLKKKIRIIRKKLLIAVVWTLYLESNVTIEHNHKQYFVHNSRVFLI